MEATSVGAFQFFLLTRGEVRFGSYVFLKVPCVKCPVLSLAVWGCGENLKGQALVGGL